MTLTLRIDNFDSLDNGGPLSITVQQKSLCVGRKGAMDWLLPDPARHISSHHFDIDYRDGGYWLTDVSTNGTFLEGQNYRLDGSHQLAHGDRLVVGHYIIVAEITSPVQPQAPMPTEHLQAAPEGTWSFGQMPPAARAPETDPWDMGGGKAMEPVNPVPGPSSPAQQFDDVGSGFVPVQTSPAQTGFQSAPTPTPQVPGVQSTPNVQGFGAELSQPPSNLTPSPSVPPLSIPPFGAPAAQAPPAQVAQPTPAPAPAPPQHQVSLPPSNFPPGAAPQMAPTSIPPAAEPQPIPAPAAQPIAAPIPTPQPSPVQPAPTGQPAAPQMSEPAPFPPRPAPPAAATSADSQAILEAFCQGAGLTGVDLTGVDAQFVAHELGKSVRATTEEMMRMLRDRSNVKQFTRGGERTMTSATGNNPIKFLPDAQQIIDAMYLHPRDGFMKGGDSFETAMKDLRVHQIAVFAALQPALSHVLAGLSPDEIEDGTSSGNLLGGSRRGRLWDIFVERWDNKANAGENGMLDAFLQAFAESYAKANKSTDG